MNFYSKERSNTIENRSVRFIRAVVVIALIVAGADAVRADVTAVSGSAYGYFSRVSLFGGAPSDRGPAPMVSLPPAGSASPISASAATGTAQYGPATIFSSDQLDVSTQGVTGPDGSVTSSANIQNVNKGGSEVFTASNVASSCSASETGVTGSTTISNGKLQTSDGNPDVDGDETIVTIPVNPAPNTTYDGEINSVGDSFRYVFNEQILNSDGSLTVNAAHQYLLGPTAVGDLIIGHLVAGVTPPGPTPTPTPTPKTISFQEGVSPTSSFVTGITYIARNAATTNFGGSNKILIGSPYRGLFKFDLRPLLAANQGKTITIKKVRLVAYSNGTAGPARKIVLNKLPQDFKEGEVTWEQLGGGTFGPEVSSATFPFGAARTVTFVSTAGFKAAVKGAVMGNGFLRLIGHTVDPSNGAFASFASDEQSFLARRPRLVVSYTTSTPTAAEGEILLEMSSDDDAASDTVDSADES